MLPPALNIINLLPEGSVVNYYHYESDNKKSYEDVLKAFWSIIKEHLTSHYVFNFSILFYRQGTVEKITCAALYQGMTILTAKINSLCANILPDVVKPIKNNIIMVMDAANGNRSINNGSVIAMSENFNRPIILLGTKNKNIKMVGVTDLTGKTTLSEAMSYIIGSEFVISPEGALGYLAFLKNVPNLTCFSLSSLMSSYGASELRCSKNKSIFTGANIIISKHIVSYIKQMNIF